MTDELVPTAQRAPAPALPPGLRPAAERFSRTTLRKSAQTQRTYASTYARFTLWLADYTKTTDPSLAAFTADVLAAYLDELGAQRGLFGRGCATSGWRRGPNRRRVAQT